MLTVRDLGLQDYQLVWQAMREFTDKRDNHTPDELWLVEHPPVFTLGVAGKMEHLIQANDIPIIRSDRGGQITYHGPGQLIAYILFAIKRRKQGIRTLVRDLESAIIKLLASYEIAGSCQPGAPGVYVAEKKIASVGLRVRHGCTYHGLSLNVAMDLTPFTWIHPCGYPDLNMTQLADHCPNWDTNQIKQQLIQLLKHV